MMKLSRNYDTAKISLTATCANWQAEIVSVETLRKYVPKRKNPRVQFPGVILTMIFWLAWQTKPIVLYSLQYLEFKLENRAKE